MNNNLARKLNEYRIRNRRHAEFPIHVRATLALVKFTKTPVVTIQSELRAVVTRKDGTIEDYGIISRRIITTAGANYIVDAHQNLTELENINFHAMGTGVNGEVVGDVTLQTEVESRVSGVQSEPAANQYRSVATITASAPRAVTEHGILSASSAGTLFDRSVFSVINLAAFDSIQFTYTVTYSSGG